MLWKEQLSTIFPSVVISKKDYPNGGFEKALIDHFKSMNVDLIILAGYMTILGEEFIKL